MTQQFIRERIGDGVFFSTVATDKFRTSRISVNLITELKRDTVTANALVSFLLRKGCAMCPDFTALNLRLDSLYGAVLDTDVKKLGDCQVINISGVCIDDRFALDGENIRSQLARLMCSIITEPVMENGLFVQREIDVEKKVLKETIESVRDDKGAYVIEKMVSKMCSEEPYGLHKYGYCEDIEELDAEKLTKCYHDILSHSRIEIICSGSQPDGEIKDVFAQAFSKIERKSVFTPQSLLAEPVSAPSEYTEKMDITQSKVALGFTSGISPTDDRRLSLSLMSAVYGATPSSKLFMNVRERMSLCYYCACATDINKGIVIAYSGVQETNRKKAIDEMLLQLEDIRNMKITDTELEQARSALVTSLESVSDSLYGLETWYFGQILGDGVIRTPQDDINDLMKITARDVSAVARDVRLKTVYSITEGGENV